MTLDRSKYEIKPLPCHARAHMGAEFLAYDYMVAACKSNPDYKPGDPLKFYGKRVRMANATNRGLTQVDDMLKKLEDKGWIIPLQGARGKRKQRQTPRGRMTTIEYEVLEHDEYAMKHEGSCPVPRYDEKTGKPIKPGRMPKPVEYARIRKLIDLDLPDFMLEPVAEAMAIKRGATVIGNPITDAMDKEGEGECGPDSESQP